MRSGTNLPRVGGYNRAVILDAIRRQDGISRVELATLTGLTNQTVSNIVRRLIDDGLVTESGRAPSRGGKRRTILRLRSDAYYSVGVHLDPAATVTVLVDLSGQILARRRRRTTSTADPKRLVRGLAATVDTVIEEAAVDRSRVLGLGVACPGPIDQRRGLVVDPPNLSGWHEVPLTSVLHEATGLPVVLDNDATAAAVGERWSGGPARAGGFVFVYAGTGIGAGIMLTDGVLRGESGNGGEFGHVVVVPDGAPCHCGGRGCLEAYCSPSAVLADLTDRYGPASADRLGLRLQADSVRADFATLCRASRAGDPAAADCVRLAAYRLGQATLSLVNLLDVGRIVLGGQAMRGFADQVRDEICRQVNSYSIARSIRTVTVESSLVGEDAGAVGAASLVLHGNYAPGWRLLLGDASAS